VSNRVQLASTREVQAYQRDWFRELRRRVFEEGAPYALTSATTPHEVFDVFDMPYVTNEWWSGLVAAKRAAGHYLDVLEERGFHRGLPHYGAIALGTLLDPDDRSAPWGGLPRPAILCARLVEQGHERQWALMADAAGAPFVPIEVPGSSVLYPRWWEIARHAWEDVFQSHRIDRVVGCFRDLVRECERITGRRFDEDRLREVLTRVHEQEECFDEVRTLICDAPRLPVRLSEQLTNVMTIQWHRGSEWALAQARRFRDEVRRRVDEGTAAFPGERIRLGWVGVGLWQNTDYYLAFEESHGAVFVRSMYLSIASDGYLRYGLRDPIRSLAGRYASFNETLHVAPWLPEWTVADCRRHRCDAVVIANLGSAVKFTEQALERAGIPALVLDVDAVDTRSWDDAALRRAVAYFIERRVAA
jgi:benzoyl-CoA reductase subunit B